MQGLRLPSAQDVVRLVRPTVPDTIIELVNYYSRQPGWSYGSARRMAKPVFSGDLSLEVAVQGCHTTGNPLGRKSNAEVAGLIWDAARGRSFKCHDLSPRLFPLRRDLHVLVNPQFFFVEAGQVKIFWLQLRRTYAPSREGMGLLAEMVRLTFADDFESVDLELLDLSAPDGKNREPRRFGFDDLPVFPEETLRQALQRFADAYDAVCKMGVKRPERRTRPSPDTPADDLFDRS